jgi:3-keto-L-gulonate-6-phosphate decarboxylase
MKADREAIEKAMETAKQSGQSVQVDLSGDRSQNAKAALEKAVSQ